MRNWFIFKSIYKFCHFILHVKYVSTNVHFGNAETKSKRKMSFYLVPSPRQLFYLAFLCWRKILYLKVGGLPGRTNTKRILSLAYCDITREFCILLGRLSKKFVLQTEIET